MFIICFISSKFLIDNYFQSKNIAAIVAMITRFKKILDNNVDVKMFY